MICKDRNDMYRFIVIRNNLTGEITWHRVRRGEEEVKAKEFKAILVRICDTLGEAVKTKEKISKEKIRLSVVSSSLH